ncbi:MULTISPECIES: hypothetical protein [Paenibacillus]|uniref:hypothetical protein n=1 Tax=Paenibacillus TaxID=44249 RepID=UPI0015C376BA|nr:MULTISPECIES: hypothetical protein [Paenibacillus]MCP3747069.1 hypothetical protein [Paenibacillus sp. A3M_27_13]
MKKSSDVVVEKREQKRHSGAWQEWDGGFEGATPRVEGSYDRCCRWILGLE